MARLRLRLPFRYRLRTLLIAIAVIGLGLGAYRWWLARREILKMAAEHRARGIWNPASIKDFEDMRAFALDGLKSTLEFGRQSGRLDAEARAIALSLGKEPPFRGQPVTPRDEVAWAEYRIEVEALDALIANQRAFAEWHRARADELEHRWFCSLEHERARDKSGVDRSIEEMSRLFALGPRRQSALHSHYATLERARARELTERLGDRARSLPADSAERLAIDFHEELADRFEQSAARELEFAAELEHTPRPLEQPDPLAPPQPPPALSASSP